MKGIYVIAVAFLASWNVCIANEDQQFSQEIKLQDNIFRKCPYPDINPKNTTTNIAHESDCTKFYKCLLGSGTEQLCPFMWPNDKTKRLHYNRALQVCDWPWNAGCELCPREDKNGDFPPESRIADPESRNCRDYIICKQDGTRQYGTCPDNTCFSRTCQDCVKDRNNGNCGPSSSITTSSTTTTTPKSTIPEPCDNRKEHECNCALYYQLYGNDWIREECEGGLHFSRTECGCTTPDIAKCILNRLTENLIVSEAYF
ncbi:uncharacterized protein [Anoplolepis gracilipes]|uniref:uncharacterized protein n=1 Tax=Anoplolepis gracilipes TaxID=354296 RepID=UPI003B9F5539